MTLVPTRAEPFSEPPAIDGPTRDYLMLLVHIYVRNGYLRRAAALVEALTMAGEKGLDVLFARLVVHFLARDWAGALALAEELERRDPVERFGRYELSDRQRMRRYVRVRCLHELGEHEHARDAIAIYLRHGTEGGGD